jgi:hypothetical protein
MSPEQAEGKPVDARTDIYSVGLVLYEMFTGEVPFKAETPVAVVHKQIHELPPSPSRSTPIFPAQLEGVLLRCLAKDPKHRYQNVGELEEALTHPERVAAEKPALPEPEVLPEPEPDPRLLFWSRRDSILLAAGIAGLIFFLTLRDTVLPASHWKLRLDALSARRQAEEIGRRLGRPFPESSTAELDFRDEVYGAAVESSIGRRNVPAWRSLWPFKLPVYWRVRFHGSQDHLLAAIGAVPEREVVIDQTGRTLRFVHTLPEGNTSRDYTATPVEERRRAARQAATDACGPLPEGLVLTEAPRTASGFIFTATGRVESENKTIRSYRVVLAGNTPTEIDCGTEREPEDTSRWNFSTSFSQAFPRLYRWFPVGVMVLLSGGIIAVFALDQSYRLPHSWRRVPPALLLGAAGIWLFRIRLPTFPEALLSFLFVAGSGLIWMGLVAGEYSLRRHEPARIAGYAMLWRGSMIHPAVTLSIVRGSLLGLIFVGLETALAWGSLSILRAFSLPELVRVFLAFVLTPTHVGYASTNPWPWLYLSCWTVFACVVGPLIVLALPWIYSMVYYRWQSRVLRRARSEREVRADRLGNPAIVFYLSLGFVVPLAQYASIYRLIGLFVLGFLLAWLFMIYDVLTVAMMIGTTILWSLGHPLLAIFSEVGNAGVWALFVAWGGLVLLAAAFMRPTAVEAWSKKRVVRRG